MVLWLKVIINMLFSWGSISETNGIGWHVWLHLCLAVFVCLSVNTKPYVNPVDFKVELFAMLTLSMVTHIASIFKTGQGAYLCKNDDSSIGNEDSSMILQ